LKNSNNFDGNKKVYGLIGKQLSHSFSKNYFDKKFAHQNISEQHEYLNFELNDISEIRNLVLKNPQIKGFNITIPYKSEVLKLVDECSEEVKIIGAANTILVSKKNNQPFLKAFNTDVIGFEKTIEPFVEKAKKEKAIVLGNGGAAKAVFFVLKKLNIDFTTVSRKAENNTLQYDDLNEDLILQHKYIINTTPLGMYPNINDFPNIPYSSICEQHIAIDLIYNPSTTLFLEKCKSQNAKTINGKKMLVLQAEASWEIWNGGL
jgi:shikimate dehydrogenase